MTVATEEMTVARETAASRAPTPGSPRREPATGEDGIDAGRIAFLAVASMIGVVIAILSAEVLYRVAFAGEWERKVIDRGTPESLATQAEQRARLEGYRWVDRAKGTVAIPVERAMELIARERAAQAGAREEPGAR